MRTGITVFDHNENSPQNYFRMMAGDSTYCNVLLQRTLMSQTLKCIKLAVTLLFHAASKREVTQFNFC